MSSRAARGWALADSSSELVVRTETTVAVRSAAEFERQRIRAAVRLATRAGFLGGTLLRSYSQPTRYVELSSYEDLEIAWALGQEHAGTEREELALGTTVTRQGAYELVHELVARPPVPVGCLVLIDGVVKRPELAPAFEAMLRELFELRRTHAAGFGFNRVLRSAGRVESFLVVEGYTDRAAAGEANTSPDVQSFIHDHPTHLYSDGPVSAEAYAVIARVPEPSTTPKEAT